MIKIPGTTASAAFYGPTGDYPPLFYSSSPTTGNMVSLNAGNSQVLDVGGGGINLGFKHALKNIQDIAKYKPRHEQLLQQAAGAATSEVYSDDDPMAFSLIDASNRITNLNSANSRGENDGVAFVDIFGPNLRPHGVNENVGMLYACPPYGDSYIDEQAFLDALGVMANNCVTVIGAYNSLAPAQAQPAISTLRMCLFSSGIYNRNVPVASDKIALAIFDGLVAVLATDDCGLSVIEMPTHEVKRDGTVHPLFAAVKTQLESDSPVEA